MKFILIKLIKYCVFYPQVLAWCFVQSVMNKKNFPLHLILIMKAKICKQNFVYILHKRTRNISDFTGTVLFHGSKIYDL